MKDSLFCLFHYKILISWCCIIGGKLKRRKVLLKDKLSFILTFSVFPIIIKMSIDFIRQFSATNNEG